MLIFFIKGKLYQTDNFLPIIYNLKQNLPKKKLIIIYPSLTDYREIKKNKPLFNSLCNIATVKYFINPSQKDKEIFRFLPTIFYSIISVIYRVIILHFFLYKRVTLFRTMDIPKTNWLVNYNRRFLKGKIASIFIYPYTPKELFKYTERMKTHNVSLNTIWGNILCHNSDILISSYSKSILHKVYPLTKKQSYEIFDIGYSLQYFKPWFNNLEKFSKNELNKIEKPFIFFPLAILHRENKTAKGIEKKTYTDLFLQILKAIRLYDNNINIVLRPHPSSSLKEIKTILKKNKLLNITISNINSAVLIKNCSFVIRWGTSTMDPIIKLYDKILIRYFSIDLFNYIKSEIIEEKDTYNIVEDKQLKKILKKVLINNSAYTYSNEEYFKKDFLTNELIKAIK